MSIWEFLIDLALKKILYVGKMSPPYFLRAVNSITNG